MSYTKVIMPPSEMLKQKLIGSGLESFVLHTKVYEIIGDCQTILCRVVASVEECVRRYMLIPENKDKGEDYAKEIKSKTYECIFQGKEEILAYVKKMLHL